MANNLPFTSLNAATVTGAGSSKDLEGSYARHTLLYRVTGGPTSAVFNFEGSHDGSTWYVLQTVTIGNPSDPFQAALTPSDYVLRYVRANLTTLTGGTAPTVTVAIASA